MVECLLKLCVTTCHIRQAHKNPSAPAQAELHTDAYMHGDNHTAFITVSCAETDRKMHVVIQRVKMVFG